MLTLGVGYHITAIMKGKLLNVLAIITSLIGLLQWGGGHSMFLLEAEAEILSKLFSSPAEALHPLTILPLIGQVLLLVTVFQKAPSKLLSLIGISCLGVLLAFLFAVGLLSFNIKTLVSTLPFIATAFFVVRYHVHKSKKQGVDG